MVIKVSIISHFSALQYMRHINLGGTIWEGVFVFLFNWKVLRYFRKDGHNWRRKDGKTVKEAQEKMEIGKRSSKFVMCLHIVAVLNCRIKKYNEAIPHFERSIEIPNLDMGQNLSLAKFAWFMHLCDTYQCSAS
ncbi:hypothetical protein P3S68_028235 [Capsicum galapagoense]